MVTVIDRRRVTLAVVLLLFGSVGLIAYARSFGPLLYSTSSIALTETKSQLLRAGWARAVGATDERSFTLNCALLNQRGCASVFWSYAWALFKVLFMEAYRALPWPHQWGGYLSSMVVGLAFFAARKRTRPLFDAHFAQPSEVKPLLAKADHPATVLLGTLKGRYLGLTADLKGPGRLPHTLVTAPPGTGKSVHLKGVLVSWRQAAVVVDIKGELRKATSSWRASQVGPVYTLSPEGRGQRFDPVAALLRLDPEAAPSLAHFLTFEPGDEPKFFAAQAQPALLAAIRSAQLLNQPFVPHLDALLSLGNKGFVAALSTQRDAVIDGHLTAFLGMPAKDFPEASYSDTRGPVFSVWQTLLERVQPLRRPRVLAMMSGSDFRVEDLLRPCTLYLAWPEAHLDADAKPLALILHSLITCLCRLADQRERLPCPILLALDEAPRYVVPALPKYLATMQGRGISALMYAQSGAQLAQNYGARNARTIQETCQVRLYLQPQLEDAERIVKQLGMVTLGGERRSRRRDGDEVVADHELQRPLLTVDEVMRLKDDQMVVLTGVYRPVLAGRLRYYRDAALRRRVGRPPLPLLPLPSLAPAAITAADVSVPRVKEARGTCTEDGRKEGAPAEKRTGRPFYWVDEGELS